MVNLIITQASLLSGSLRDCAQIENLHSPDSVALDDSVCSQGGIAAVQALNRMYSSDSTPSLVIPTGDFKSPLTAMSRFGFGVNTMIFGELGFRTWTLPAYTLWPGRLEEEALFHAQDPNFPAVVSNVVTSPEEGPHPYINTVHFDPETSIALLYVTKEYLYNTESQVISVQRLLHFIYKRNQANGCDLDDLPPAYSVDRSAYSTFSFGNQPFSEWFQSDPQPNRNATFPPLADDPESCFIPVVVFDDKDQEQYNKLITSFRQAVQVDMRDEPPTLLPHLLLDFYGHALPDGESVSIADFKSQNTVNPNATTVPGGASIVTPTTWVVSYKGKATNFHQLEMSIAEDRRSILGVNVTTEDLNDLPDEALTSDYYEDLNKLRQYAREAVESSLVDEPGVPTTAMPEMTSADDGFRKCYVGECELGNMFADAIRWTAQADVAVLPSFMFNGPGWTAGEIRTLEILENVPYTAPWCEARMTGNSMLRLLQHSIATTSFGPYDGVQTGGRLLQVSGMRLLYNNELEAGTGNILSVGVWNKSRGEFVPLNRTQIYSVASCNHLCFTFSDFPNYMGPLLVEEGEAAAVAYADTDIKNEAKNYLLTNFYDAGETYQPALDGRIQADLSNTLALKVNEAAECIPEESFWDSSVLDCVPCPTFAHVQFSDAGVALSGQAYSSRWLVHHMTLTNNENFSIQVTPEILALPENIQLNASLPQSDTEQFDGTNDTAMVPLTTDSLSILGPNSSMHFEIGFDPSERDPGTDTSSLVFAVKELTRSGSCADDFAIRYEIVARLSLSTNSHNLRQVSAFGFSAAVIIILTSIYFAVSVHRLRQTRVVAAVQPFFLMTICFGIFLIGSSLIVLSIDDGIASHSWCSIACMARPWLLSLGFLISIAALYSKLSRINRLFQVEQFRKSEVREIDVVLLPVMAVLVNIVLLVIWTIGDPLQWKRIEVQGQPWNTYGTCQLGDGTLAHVMFSLVLVLCGVSLLLTMWQAFRARNIGSEFSESKFIGIAVFSWVQLSLVGVPLMFLVDEANVVARYSLVVGLVTAVCMTMLLLTFLPIITYKERDRNLRSAVILSGLSLQGSERNHMFALHSHNVDESSYSARNVHQSSQDVSSRRFSYSNRESQASSTNLKHSDQTAEISSSAAPETMEMGGESPKGFSTGLRILEEESQHSRPSTHHHSDHHSNHPIICMATDQEEVCPGNSGDHQGLPG
eukprot:Nitzschia sp. Nitz4//scaffold65_size103378//56010//59639//NITZ4_004469-RA/size103378-processed-gene-0.51-mRNA-1//-1//CDS//3329556249//4395//frame0